MRIRTIKPEFWRSPDVAELSREHRLLWIGLWSYVDDNGVGIDDHRIIAAELFALDDPIEAREFVREGLATLSRGLRIARYALDGRSYLYVNGWDRHQRIDRPGKARYPLPPADLPPPPEDETPAQQDPEPPAEQEFATPSRDTRETLAPGTGEQGNRGTGEQGEEARETARSTARATRIPDDFAVTDDMITWARENTPLVGRPETDKFVDYWRAKSGKDATKRDWIATWRNWMRRAQDDAERRGPARPQGRTTRDDRVNALDAFLVDETNQPDQTMLRALPGGAA